jgi:hypothetical protein
VNSSGELVSGSEKAPGIWPASYMTLARTSTSTASPAATSGLACTQWMGAGFGSTGGVVGVALAVVGEGWTATGAATCAGGVEPRAGIGMGMGGETGAAVCLTPGF